MRMVHPGGRSPIPRSLMLPRDVVGFVKILTFDVVPKNDTHAASPCSFTSPSCAVVMSGILTESERRVTCRTFTDVFWGESIQLKHLLPSSRRSVPLKEPLPSLLNGR